MMTTNPVSPAQTPPNAGSFTAIITGISPISEISTSLVSSLITHLSPNDRPLSIALLGPDLEYLQSTTTKLQCPSVTLLPVACTLTSPESLGLAAHEIRGTLGAWDLFIHNPSAHIQKSQIHKPATIRGSDEDTWWDVFEVNVHALHHVARHFFSKMKRGAKFLNILPVPIDRLSASVSKKGSFQNGKAAEHAAAIAAAKIVDYLAVEHQQNDLIGLNVEIEAGETVAEAEKAERVVKIVLPP